MLFPDFALFNTWICPQALVNTGAQGSVGVIEEGVPSAMLLADDKASSRDFCPHALLPICASRWITIVASNKVDFKHLQLPIYCIDNFFRIIVSSSLSY